MSNCRKFLPTWTGFFLLGILPLYSQTLRWQGQASSWATVNLKKNGSTLGIRYIPSLSASVSGRNEWTLDSEIAINTYTAGTFFSSDPIQYDRDIKPYRIWLRLSSNQFEARLGLQKINFGSAVLLRPLMWFDRIDPRDPLQLTDGAYALLLRYYFINNANIWIWGLLGNDETKGWEQFPSHPEKPEWGGRLQAPFLQGEWAVTFHHRESEITGLNLGSIPDLLDLDTTVPENRIALDGKWDIEIGLWIEGVLVHRDIFLKSIQYQRFINAGADYTFGLGNGIHVLTETIQTELSKTPFGAGERTTFSACSVNYPIGLLDTITSMIYYDWDNQEWYRFVNFQRTWDRWSGYLIGFWNPDSFQFVQGQSGSESFSGKGFQIMLVWNH